MSHFLDIFTVMLCTGLVTLVVSLILSFVWYFERGEKAVGWWSAATWVMTVGLVILSFRTSTPMWFGVALGNATILVGYGLVSAGYAVFAGRPVNWILIAAGPAMWILSLILFQEVRDDVNLRIAILTAPVLVYTLMAASAAYQSWKQEALLSALLAVIFYCCHAVVFSLRIPLAFAYPIDAATFLQEFNWFTVLSLEGFVQAVFSSFVFIVLARERAERRYKLAAEIDSLTSVASRRFFVSETRAVLARKPKAGVLAVLDLDFFKKVNDTYGHMAGDRVLQLFAAHVSGFMERGMIFGRLGGEEFGLYLKDATEEQAAEYLERLRSSIEALDIHFNGQILKTTSSIGAASIAHCGLDFDHLMAGADNALYVSKHEGRNRITLFHPSMRLRMITQNGKESRLGLAKGRVSRVSVRHRFGRA